MVGMPTVDQHWPNVGMMLALCPQHWPYVGAGGHWYVGPTSHQWLADGWPNIGPSSAQHWHVYGDLGGAGRTPGNTVLVFFQFSMTNDNFLKMYLIYFRAMQVQSRDTVRGDGPFMTIVSQIGPSESTCFTMINMFRLILSVFADQYVLDVLYI